MTFDPAVRAAIIGCGVAGRSRIRSILADFRNTSIDVVSEPSAEAYIEAAAIFEEAGQPVPPNVPDLDRLLDEHGHSLDVAFVVTPHALHFSQARACLEAGLDVLLEKPMVMNVQEARELIEARDRTGRVLVVSFQGSLSPHIRKAVKMLRSGRAWVQYRPSPASSGRTGAATSGTGGGGTPGSPAAASCSTAAPTC